jgi:hypothetical protein
MFAELRTRRNGFPAIEFLHFEARFLGPRSWRLCRLSDEKYFDLKAISDLGTGATCDGA